MVKKKIETTVTKAKSGIGAEFFAKTAKKTGGDVLSAIDSVSYFVDTGNLAVNYICSGYFIKGGVPGGKLSEIFGPSSSSKSLFGNNILFGCQKMGGIAVLIDAENSANKEFIKRASHADLDRILRYTPPTLEQVFAKIYEVVDFIRKEHPDVPIVIVYDSITVSPCERELREVNLPPGYTTADFKRIVGAKSQPGERAKVCSAEFRKLNTMMEKHGVTVVILNQTRSKIGVLYGCHFGKSLVYLADGSMREIGQIVRNRESVEVLSYNSENGQVEPKKVIAWHNNGRLSEQECFLKIKFRRHHRNAFGYLRCTPNHILFTEAVDGGIAEIQAGNIRIGDKLALVQPCYLSEDQWQLVYGSILGDGGLRKHEKLEDSNYQLRLIHCNAQKCYLDFKVGVLGNLVGTSGSTKSRKHGGYYSDSKPMYELNRLSSYKDDGYIPAEIADNLNEFGLAIWYMDDGSYAGHHEKWGSGKSVIYCMKFKNREIMLPALERLGLKATLSSKGFRFDSENTFKLHTMIARFVPECMEYKIHPQFHGLFGANLEIYKPIEYRCVSGKVIEIETYECKGDSTKYDLTVEGNATYVVSSAIVHNSPETTGGGGNALEFYASCRLRPQTQKKIEQKLSAKKNKILGINVKMVNKKNKTHRPFVESDGIQLTFDKGINPLGGLLSCLLDDGRLLAKGSGNFSVKEPWAGGSEVNFKGSLDTTNTVPLDILFQCPMLIDAQTADEVREYLEPFKTAMEFEIKDDVVETDVTDGDNEDVIGTDEQIDAELEIAAGEDK